MINSMDDTQSRNHPREAMDNQQNLHRPEDDSAVDSESEKLQRLSIEKHNNAANENDSNDGWNNAGKATNDWNNVGWGEEFKDEDNARDDKWSAKNGWGETGEDFREENNGKGMTNGWNDWGEEFKDDDNKKEESYDAEVPETREHDSGDRIKRKNGALKNNRGLKLPMRTGAEDCAFYMKTGSCKFGSGCKFSHPPREIQSVKELPRGSKPGCKFHMRPEGCKFGDSCKFLHSIERPSATQIKPAPSPEFNSFGLPIRPGEKQCSYYIRNGSCKFGSTCRFHHPDFSVAVKSEPPSKPLTNPSYEAATAPIKSVFQPQNRERDANPVELSSNNGEFPERPEQPECSHFVKTGYCKFKSSCKFHHPKSQPSCALSEKGLPLRPDQSVCAFYGRYGICKFGPSCRYNHPIQPC